MGCWIILGIVVAIVIWTNIRAQEKKELQARQAREKAEAAEEKRREREAWLFSPEGLAWQEKEHEKARMQKEEEDRKRNEAEELEARRKWKLYHESATSDEVAKMSGKQFEQFLARLFAKMGYTSITTSANTDQGGDLLCLSPSGVRVVVQAKRWKGSVGNGAVQELLGAMLHYDCAEGIVVTNSTFTRAARELAGKDARIRLRDGWWLKQQIERFLPPQIPDFSWEEFNKRVRDYKAAQCYVAPSRQKTQATKKPYWDRNRRQRW